MGFITQTARQYYSAEEGFIGTGSQSTFTLTFDPLPDNIDAFTLFIDDVEIANTNYTYTASTGVIDFTPSTPPILDAVIKVVLKQTRHGNYRYISLEDIVNNFMVSYVGDDKIINTVKKLDVIFHTKRAVQEFSYDISKVEKIQEIQVGPTLTVPFPQDYVNYVQLSFVDTNGIERIIYPTTNTSRPSESILQDNNADYLYDSDDSLLTGTAVIKDRFKGIENIDNTGSFDDLNSSISIGGLGQRFGNNPETTQTNGLFIIDELNGQFGFSSNLESQILTLKYISDGLGTDSEMKVHKLAEEAIYKYVAHAVLASKANIPEYIINRFKRERRAAMRNAKIRLSNMKTLEMAQVMRGKSKQIKH